MSNVSTWLDNMAKGTGLPVNSDHAKQLMDLTMGIESQFGKYKKQAGGGPAQGIFQIEPTTRKDIIRYAQQRQPKIYRHLQSLPSGAEKDAVLARTKYWMSPDPIPEDDAGKAAYWKKYYQAGGNRGATAEQALARYQEGKKKPTVQGSSPRPMPARQEMPLAPVSWQDELVKELGYAPSDNEMFSVEHGGSQMTTVPGRLGRLGRKWVVDPVRRLGDIMSRYGESGEISTNDAAEFALMGLIGGEPGGLPAGEVGAGSVTRTKLPFTSRLSKLMERGMIGDRVVSPKTKMKELAKMISKDPVLLEEIERTYPEYIWKGEKPLVELSENYKKTKNINAPENNILKTTLTGDDVQYGDYTGYREAGGDDYYEVIYNDPHSAYSAPHFTQELATEPIKLSENYVSHRRGNLTNSINDPNMLLLGQQAEKVSKQIEEVTDMIEYFELVGEKDSQSYKNLTDNRNKLSDQKDSINDQMYKEGEKLRQKLIPQTKEELHDQLAEIENQIKATHPKRAARLRGLDEEWNDVQVKLDNFDKYYSNTAHTTEIQSDLHQAASKAGGYEGTDALSVKRDKWTKERRKLETEYLDDMARMTELTNQIEEMPPGTIGRVELKKERNTLQTKTQKHLDKIYKFQDKFNAEAPDFYPKGKVYWKTHLKDAIHDAIAQGKDNFTWTTGATQAKRNKRTVKEAQGYINKYDRDFVKFFKQEFGVTPTKRFIPDNNQSYGVQEVWHIPITEAIKKKMLNAKNLPMAKIDRFRTFG